MSVGFEAHSFPLTTPDSVRWLCGAEPKLSQCIAERVGGLFKNKTEGLCMSKLFSLGYCKLKLNQIQLFFFYSSTNVDVLNVVNADIPCGFREKERKKMDKERNLCVISEETIHLQDIFQKGTFTVSYNFEQI